MEICGTAAPSAAVLPPVQSVCLPADDVIMAAAEADAAARPTSPPERVRERAHVASFHVRGERASEGGGRRGWGRRCCALEAALERIWNARVAPRLNERAFVYGASACSSGPTCWARRQGGHGQRPLARRRKDRGYL